MSLFRVEFPASEWESSIAAMEKIDRNEYFATLFYARAYSSSAIT